MFFWLFFCCCLRLLQLFMRMMHRCFAVKLTPKLHPAFHRHGCGETQFQCRGDLFLKRCNNYFCFACLFHLKFVESDKKKGLEMKNIRRKI